MNPLTRFAKFIAQFLIGFYRVHLSGFFGGVCRYEPSCSCYAEQAFQQYPPSYALYLTIRRLLRCHPFAPFGIDPLPTPGDRLEQQH